MIKKLFISQPMRDKSENDILKERENAIYEVKKLIGEDEIEVLDTYFDDHKDYSPLECLGKSIVVLSKADIAFFCKGWEDYRGCKIEHLCAISYGIPCILNTSVKDNKDEKLL